MRVPIRLRLTVVFALSMLVLLVVTSGFVYLRLGAELLHTLDTALRAQATTVAAGLGQQGAAFSAPAAPGTQGLDSFTQVLGPGGRVLESSLHGGTGPALPASTVASIHRPVYLDRVVPGIPGTARIVVLPQTDERHPSWVVAGASLAGRDHVLSALLLLLLAGGAAALAVAATVGWAVAGAALRPVERMRLEADAISVSDRDRRLSVPASRDEIERLGKTLNTMLGRLQAAFDRERRFVDDASHELRTPLAILKAELDIAQSRPRSNQELLAAIRRASEEADRLTSLAETLLVYSRAESGRMPLRREPTDLNKLLGELCAALAGQAAAAGVAVRVDPHAVTAAVDPVRVRQAVENLLSNALAHTPRGGQVHVSAALDNGIARVTVHDTGEGFDPGFLPYAFEPFATGPAEQARADRGAGLGLAIVRAIAEAHGGRATAQNGPGGGARVSLLLPTGS